MTRRIFSVFQFRVNRKPDCLCLCRVSCCWGRRKKRCQELFWHRSVIFSSLFRENVWKMKREFNMEVSRWWYAEHAHRSYLRVGGYMSDQAIGSSSFRSATTVATLFSRPYRHCGQSEIGKGSLPLANSVSTHFTNSFPPQSNHLLFHSR